MAWETPKNVWPDYQQSLTIKRKRLRHVMGKKKVLREVKAFLKDKEKVRLTLLPGTRLIIEDVSTQ